MKLDFIQTEYGAILYAPISSSQLKAFGVSRLLKEHNLGAQCFLKLWWWAVFHTPSAGAPDQNYIKAYSVIVCSTIECRHGPAQDIHFFYMSSHLIELDILKSIISTHSPFTFIFKYCTKQFSHWIVSWEMFFYGYIENQLEVFSP